MEKIRKHLKNNFAIYIVLVTCTVILGIAISVNSKPKVEKVDTSMFEVVTLDEALELFETDEPKLLVMSVDTCSATKGYVPYLQIAEAKRRYVTYYLDLNSIDTSSEAFKEFQAKLDMEYTLFDKVDKFSTFMESTPQTIIIKNKKMVYGHIGSMSTDTLVTLTDLYGVGTNEEN